MKIFVTGTRGIPDIPGGVEKHCQELYPRIVSAKNNVFLATRQPYVVHRLDTWAGIRLCHGFAPRRKSLEAVVHTFLSVIKARFYRVDLVHIHAVGPGLMVPLARILGMKVVWTNHGPDYDRGKWGALARKILRLGEWLGGRFANEVIVISSVIEDIIQSRCQRQSHLIYNGVTLPDKTDKIDFLQRLKVVPGKYLLAVARFVPEKGLHDLISAFSRVPDEACQLVIAGDADHESEYSRSIKELAAKDRRIILTGYITGESLNQVYSHACLFVLPSYHEGLPIALLEAMSYDLPVLVSDIPANREVSLVSDRFFQCGNIEELLEKIEYCMERGITEDELRDYRLMLAQKYNWDLIAEQTIAVYRKML